MTTDEDFDESGMVLGADPSFLEYLSFEPDQQDEALRATLVLLYVQTHGRFPTSIQSHRDIQDSFKFIRGGAWIKEAS